jgi:hypothetical protein
VSLAVRVGAAASAVFWAVFFFGLIDLGVLADPRDFLPVVALEAGWGVLFTFFVAGPLVVVAWRPQAAVACAVQLFLAAVALLVGSLLGLDARPLPVALALGVTAVLVLLPQRARLRSEFVLAPDRPLVALAVVAAPFCVVHALHAFSASRGGPFGGSDITWGIDHWPVLGAAALTIVLSSAAASVWPGGRRLLGATTCLAGTVLGVASLAYPDSSGAMTPSGWAVAAILWAVAVGLLSNRRASRSTASTGPAS